MELFWNLLNDRFAAFDEKSGSWGKCIADMDRILTFKKLSTSLPSFIKA
jgi:hypothetical protein